MTTLYAVDISHSIEISQVTSTFHVKSINAAAANDDAMLIALQLKLKEPCAVKIQYISMY